MKLNRWFFLLASLTTLLHASTSSVLYVGDGGSFLVNAFDSSANLLSTISPVGGFDSPTGIAVGLNGDVYIGNQSSGLNAEVYVYNPNTSTLSSLVPFGAGSLSLPSGVTIGPDGNLYVADLQQDLVDEFNATTGAFIATTLPANSLSSPEGIAFGPNGDLYIADAGGIEQWDGTTLTNFAFINGSAEDLAFGPGGDLYVTDSTNSLIRVFNSTGTDIMDFGSADLDQPIGLAFGPDGDLYVSGADASFGSAIQVYDPTTGNFLSDFTTYNGANFVNPQFLAFGTETPEASTLVLCAFGLAGIFVSRRRSRRGAA